MTWEQVLDAIEQRIDAAETALDNDEILAIDPFVPPAEIEPLPAELYDRAVDALRRQSEVEQRIETLKQAIVQEIGNTARAKRNASPFTESRTPSFVDSKA